MKLLSIILKKHEALGEQMTPMERMVSFLKANNPNKIFLNLQKGYNENNNNLKKVKMVGKYWIIKLSFQTYTCLELYLALQQYSYQFLYFLIGKEHYKL